jgi:hypothetical protein
MQVMGDADAFCTSARGSGYEISTARLSAAGHR